MQFISFFKQHIDVAIATLIVIAGIFDSLILGYDAPYLAGSIPMAILMGAGLAMLMTFPFYFYLIGKYGYRAFAVLQHRS